MTGFGVPRTPERDWIQKRRSQDGILAYRSPEQLADERVDERSDLYSLGVVFYEMLTDMLPYQAADARQLQQKILLQKALPIALIRPEVPAALAAIVSRLLAGDPADRFSCAADVQAELQQLLDGRQDSRRQESLKTKSSAPAPAAGAQATLEGDEEEPLSFIFNDLDETQMQSAEQVVALHDVMPAAATPIEVTPIEVAPIEATQIEVTPNEVAEVLTAEVLPPAPAAGHWEARDEERSHPITPAALSLSAYAGAPLAPTASPSPLRRRPVGRYVLIAFLIGYSLGIVVLVYSGRLTSWFARPASLKQTSADGTVPPAMENQLLSTSEAAAPADSEPAPAEESPAPPASEAAVIPSQTGSPATKLREQLRQQNRRQGAKVDRRKGRRTVTKASRAKSQRPGRRLKFWN